MNPKGRSGKLSKGITVNTNDPENRAVKLTLKANIIAAVNIEPTHLNFGQLEAGQEKTLTATVWFREDLKAKVTGVESSHEHVRARLLPEPDDKGRQVIEATMSKESAPGPLHAVITLKTTAGDQVRARITTRGQVMGDLTYEPRALNLRAGSGKVVLHNRDGKRPPFKLLDVQPTAPEFKVSVNEIEKGNRYELVVEVEPTGDIHRGSLVVKTDNKVQPELKIPLSYVKPRAPGSTTPRAPRPRALGKNKQSIELRPK